MQWKKYDFEESIEKKYMGLFGELFEVCVFWSYTLVCVTTHVINVNVTDVI